MSQKRINEWIQSEQFKESFNKMTPTLWLELWESYQELKKYAEMKRQVYSTILDKLKDKYPQYDIDEAIRIMFCIPMRKMVNEEMPPEEYSFKELAELLEVYLRVRELAKLRDNLFFELADLIKESNVYDARMYENMPVFKDEYNVYPRDMLDSFHKKQLGFIFNS